MQSEWEVFSRRHFLQWSAAAGAAVAGAGAVPLSTEAQTTLTGERKPPQQRVTLRSPEVTVVLDAASGLPYEYRVGAQGARLRGEDLGLPIEATICQKDPWSFATLSVTPQRHLVTASTASFALLASHADTPAAGFTVRYTLEGRTLVITLEEIEEHPGFELIGVRLPRLVSVQEADPSAWLVHGEEGGSFVLLRNARTGSLPPNRFWGNVLGTLPIVMVGTAEAMCVLETTAFMDGTLLAVSGSKGSRRASLGTDQVHRVNGGACYDLNLGKGRPLNCGNASTPNLLVDQTSRCRLDFLPAGGDPSKAWIMAGRLVRNRMPEIPNTFYNDKFVYGIRCDQPLFTEPSATFVQCAKTIRQIAALTDSSPQVVHLWGWQFRGKDTGYPAVNVVDERIGGYDGMMHLMEQARAWNATVTLSDNYDDAYRSSPAWNPDDIARRPDGKLWESRAWTGERSYILGLAKYMDGPGPDRIRYTCERYKLQHTTHIDVLSYYSIRNDWDREHPASGIRNLFDGRYKVFEGFAERGVDVSSEALRYPMIGRISSYWYLSGPGPCPFGGTPVPLVPLIYGKSAVWGLSGHDAHGDPAAERILERFYGARTQSIIRADTDIAHSLDEFYLGMVPFFLLRGRNLEDFGRTGDQTRIYLEGGVFLESNLTARKLRISLGGSTVLEDDAVFCPLGDDRVACYAITPRTLTVHVPDSWAGAQVTAATLFANRREEATVTQRGNVVEVTVQARQPVMLYRDRSAAGLS